jgi:hypothetical protein
MKKMSFGINTNECVFITPLNTFGEAKNHSYIYI